MVCVANNRDTFSHVPCGKCGNIFTLMYNRQDMTDWLSGSGNIQTILHYLTAGERELLLSGFCGDCFDEMFDLDNAS